MRRDLWCWVCAHTHAAPTTVGWITQQAGDPARAPQLITHSPGDPVCAHTHLWKWAAIWQALVLVSVLGLMQQELGEEIKPTRNPNQRNTPPQNCTPLPPSNSLSCSACQSTSPPKREQQINKLYFFPFRKKLWSLRKNHWWLHTCLAQCWLWPWFYGQCWENVAELC